MEPEDAPIDYNGDDDLFSFVRMLANGFRGRETDRTVYYALVRR
jgi:hypothetical protein